MTLLITHLPPYKVSPKLGASPLLPSDSCCIKFQLHLNRVHHHSLRHCVIYCIVVIVAEILWI